MSSSQSSEPLQPTQASLASIRGRIGAYALHASRDSRIITLPARIAFNARFYAEVDPDGTLQSQERDRRAEFAKKRYFQALALKSAKARRRKGAA
jgi:hypothetical protein